jgi:hypothetical protein
LLFSGVTLFCLPNQSQSDRRFPDTLFRDLDALSVSDLCTTSRSLREFPGTESPAAPLVQQPTGFSGMEDQILQPASSELTIRRCHERMGNPATF